MRLIRAIVAAAALAGSVVAAPAGATPLTFTYGGVQTGAAPSGSPPWLTAQFTDLAPVSGFGRVLLTLTPNLQSDSESITDVMFNLNPSLDASMLNITGTGGTASGSFVPPKGNNTIVGPGGAGLFDFEFTFKEFTGKEFFQTVLIYPTQLAPSDFDFLSSPTVALTKTAAALTDATGRNSIADVQGIPPTGGTGSIFGAPPQNVVPEPDTLALLGIALMGFVAGSRRSVRR